jgi:hypothetical protein
VRILGDSIESRMRERDFIAELAAAQGTSPIAALRTGNAKPELIARRNQFNTPRGPALFAPDPRCARRVQTDRAPLAPGAIVLIASDGILVPVTDFARYTADAFMTAVQERGLAAIAEEIRAAEAEDPEGLKYPRFKPSDDATALLLRVAV